MITIHDLETFVDNYQGRVKNTVRLEELEPQRYLLRSNMACSSREASTDLLNSVCGLRSRRRIGVANTFPSNVFLYTDMNVPIRGPRDIQVVG